jgi:hypothetical protein
LVETTSQRDTTELLPWREAVGIGDMVGADNNTPKNSAMPNREQGFLLLDKDPDSEPTTYYHRYGLPSNERARPCAPPAGVPQTSVLFPKLLPNKTGHMDQALIKKHRSPAFRSELPVPADQGGHLLPLLNKMHHALVKP